MLPDHVGPGQREDVVIALLVLGQARDRPRNRPRPVPWFWICVPNAPSKIRMRCAAWSRKSARALLGVDRHAAFSCTWRLPWAHAQQVADRIGQLGAVERVEMEVAHAARIERAAQFGGDRGGDQLARRGGRPALRTGPPSSAGISAPQASANLRVCATLVTGRMPGRIGASMPCAAATVAEPEEGFGREEELRDRAGGAGVQLALQIVEVGLRVRRIGMGFGIGGDRNVEGRDAPSAPRPGPRRWHSRPGCGTNSAPVVRRIAAQRDDVAHARFPVCLGHLVGSPPWSHRRR